jgi:galactose-1-phosphate uridylyltransferase
LSNPKIADRDKTRVNNALHSHDSFEDIIAKNIVHEQNSEKALIKNRLILTITWEIAKADGKIDEREILLHNKMAKILQIPQETIDEVRYLVTPKLILNPC